MIKKVIFIIIIILQFVIIGFLIGNIFQKSSVKGVSVSPLDSSDYIFTSDTLRFFYEPKPNKVIRNRIGDEESINQINSDSLNEERDYTEIKENDVFRIITLGDSFTFGLYVDTNFSWPKILENKLNELSCINTKTFEVINLGVPGYDNQYILERFKKRGIKYNPDMVLWMHTHLLRASEKEIPMLNQMPLDRESWVSIRNEITHNYDREELFYLQKKYIDEFLNIYRRPVGFIFINGMRDSEKDVLKSVINKRDNGFVVDSIPNLSEKDAVFADDMHPNKKGHNLIANEIYKYLLHDNIIPCN